MSGRRRESLAPSMFPFLAVLLCTMGSLVLLLMLIVSGAQASAKKVSEEFTRRKEELQSVTALAKSSYERQLNEGRVELEKQRLVLQHYESHIVELLQELEELKQKAELLKDDVSAIDQEQQQRKLTELEQKLAEATKDLEQKLDKPDGDKPVFAIIPYEGPHGTHRRPIYLECVADGIRIQPQGILLTPSELAPPHGPGNPLDAALRVIRAEFPPPSGAVTRTAYPLLVVRPSGIHMYALARAAMSTWDDQFGYELIDDELELVFPPGEPGLERKIVQAIELAKQRQQAIMMAMPGKYRRTATDDALAGSYGSSGDGRFGGGANYPGDGGPGNESFSESNNFAEGRGGFRGNPGMDSGPNSGTNSQSAANGFNSSPGETAAELTGGGAGNGDRGDADRRQPGSAPGSVPSYFTPGQGDPASAFADSASSRAGSAGERNDDPDQTPAQGGVGAGDGASTGGSEAPSNPAMAASGGSASGTSNPSQNGGSATQNPASSASSQSQDGEESQAGAPQVSLNMDFSNQQPGNEKPVAAQRGRNWAWSEGPASQTPVVRALHLHCFNDRWILLPESGNPDLGTVMLFHDNPQARAEKLAAAIRQRVESWGLAIAGGYWKPVLVVDVSADAGWRLRQLQQLLDGSGIEVRLRSKRR